MILSRPLRNAHTQAPTVPDPRVLEARTIHMSDRISFLASRDGDGADCRAPSVLVGPCAALGGPWGVHLQLRRGRSGERARAGRSVCVLLLLPLRAVRTRVREQSQSTSASYLERRRPRRKMSRRVARDVPRRSAAFFLRMTPSPPGERVTVHDRRARHKKGMDGGWRPMEPRLGRSASRSRRASVSPGRGRLPPPMPSPRLHSHTRTLHAARRTRASCVCTCGSMCASEAARAACVPFRASSPRRTGEDPADRGFADSQTHPRRLDARPPRHISTARSSAYSPTRTRARALGTPGTGARLALNSRLCPPIPAYSTNYTTAPSWCSGACGPHQFGDATRPGLLIGAYMGVRTY